MYAMQMEHTPIMTANYKFQKQLKDDDFNLVYVVLTK